MFDIGLCPPGSLRGDTLLVTHGHADHMAGLPYFISNRAMAQADPPKIHLPQEIVEPVRTIMDCWGKIEDFEPRYDMYGHVADDYFQVGKDLWVRALKADHRVPCLGYAVERVSQRLKPEFRGLQGAEIAARKKQGEVLTQAHRSALLCVSGDTRIEFFLQHEQARKSRILIHEVTAWDDQRDVERTRQWGHTHVDELIEHVEAFEGEALLLVHRSMRHSKAQAEKIVQERFPASVRDRVHVFGG